MIDYAGPEHLTPEQWELECTMLELCQAYRFATWTEGFEYELWQLVTSGRRDWPYPPEDAADQLELLDSIRVLSERTGCWIIMDGTMSSRPVPLEEWRRIYEQSGWEDRNPMPTPEV